jgi:hypothetical protein
MPAKRLLTRMRLPKLQRRKLLARQATGAGGTGEPPAAMKPDLAIWRRRQLPNGQHASDCSVIGSPAATVDPVLTSDEILGSSLRR